MGQDEKGRFYKGHKTWNAGTKGQGLTGPNSGSFKKGSVPPNRKPLWSERVDSKDGYILMKVPEKDPYTGFPTRYREKHKWIYEQTHGPVPKGYVVIFRDQDKRNFDPENLEAIKRADLARINQHGYKHEPDELKPSILALCRLKTKIGEARRKMMEGKERCIIEGCEKDRFCRGLCKPHYWRWQKKADATIEPLPASYGKGQKKDRLEKIRESAERVRDKSSKLKAEREKKDGSQKVDMLPVMEDPVSTDIVSSPVFNVEKMEERNKSDIKVFARVFMAGLKSELISAMTERINGQAGAE